MPYSYFDNYAMRNLFIVHDYHYMNSHSFFLTSSYDIFFTDKIGIAAGGGLSYFMTTWENTLLNTSGDFNKIFPLVEFHGLFFPFRFTNPIPMIIGTHIGMTILYHPSTYEIESGDLITVDDWILTIRPFIRFTMDFPK